MRIRALASFVIRCSCQPNLKARWRAGSVRSPRSDVAGLFLRARSAKQKHGAPGKSRTCNLRIRSPLLYPVELRALLPGFPGANREGLYHRLFSTSISWFRRSFPFSWFLNFPLSHLLTFQPSGIQTSGCRLTRTRLPLARAGVRLPVFPPSTFPSSGTFPGFLFSRFRLFPVFRYRLTRTRLPSARAGVRPPKAGTTD